VERTARRDDVASLSPEDTQWRAFHFFKVRVGLASPPIDRVKKLGRENISCDLVFLVLRENNKLA
jgi:hypothetical protein